MTLKHLDVSTCDELTVKSSKAEPKRACVTLGIQFLISTSGICWRYDPAKVAAWKTELAPLLQRKDVLSAREIARIVGTVVWHQTVLLRPYGEIADLLSLMRDVSAAARAANWDVKFPPQGKQLQCLGNRLRPCLQNCHIEVPIVAPPKPNDHFTIFTDSSDDG